MDISFSSLDEAQLYFARTLHGKTWDLIEKTDRTPQENELMVLAASASLYHWLQVGKIANRSRGEWLLARVYTLIGSVTQALSHAGLTLELTELHLAEMEEFDLPFALECMARALALAGNYEEARQYRDRAESAGAAIVDEEERKIFMDELRGGDWYGL